MSLFLFSLAFANTEGNDRNNASNEKCKDKQEKSQEEKVKTLPAQVDFYDEGAYKQEAMEVEPEPAIFSSEADSATSSITKYNYLFYFIYKYKFENKFGLDQIERLITDD